MQPKNGKPYVWMTWITGLLAGTDKCVWRVWVKSRYRYEKRPESPESVERLRSWIVEHDAMVVRRAEAERALGHDVRVEDQNSIKIEGTTAVLSGKPDILVLKQQARRAVVIDEKSGKVKDQYIWQVLLYMFALKLTGLKDWIIEGEVEYKDNFIVPVKSVQLNNTNISRIGEVITMVGSPQEPSRVPSKWECEYCDIVACPDRFKEGQAQTVDASKYF